MMATNTFFSEGTRIYHGGVGAAIAICRLVASDSNGNYIACPTGERPAGVSSHAIDAADHSMEYHRLGKCNVETDGSAAAGEYIKAGGSSDGKGIKDSSPGITTAGRVLSVDAATNIAFVELWV